MFDIIRDVVKNEYCRVIGYCVVRMVGSEAEHLADNYDEKYKDAKNWLIIYQTIDHGGEGIEDDMENVISIFPMNDIWMAYDDLPIAEYTGGYTEFALAITKAETDSLCECI